MGRRYYCDYCNKTFIDDLDARKKHLSSSHHLKLRNLHYELNRDPRTLLAEESTKTPCRRFMQSGSCQFAGNCKYTHYTQEELWDLKQQINYVDYENSKKNKEQTEIPSLESWLEKYNKNHNGDREDSDVVNTFWTYPEQLECRTDVPASLKKFRPEDFVDDKFDEWG